MLTENSIREMLGRMLYEVAIVAQEKHDPPAPVHRFDAIPPEQKAALIETAELFANKLCPAYAKMVEALKLAIGFWYHDHPNDTHAAQEAYREVKEALAKAEAVKVQE